MIDNPVLTLQLLELMDEALPMTVTIPPALAETLTDRSPELIVPSKGEVTAIEYLGDEGGIMCVIDVEGQDDEEHALVVSLTHLKIDGRHPLSRRIAAYQKRRQKRLAEEKRLITYAAAHGLLEHPFEYPIHRP